MILLGCSLHADLVFAYEPDSADEGKAFAGPLCDYVKGAGTMSQRVA